MGAGGVGVPRLGGWLPQLGCLVMHGDGEQHWAVGGVGGGEQHWAGDGVGGGEQH